jgi:hypothetical protein
MAIPILHLNLVPPPTLWRQNHDAFGIAALLGGTLALVLASGFSIQKYVQASREGRRIVSISSEAQKVAREQTRVVESLQQVDAVERLPRYRLAERIFLERALPWSRLTTEMERNLVQDVRVKSLQRIRASDGSVSMKIRGEARTRAAEALFIEALQGNGMFSQVVLEREAERTGGGIDFDVALPVVLTPPSFEPLPIPPTQVVDQFGKPVGPGAKVVKSAVGAQSSVPSAKGSPLKPAALPGAAPLKAQPAPAPLPLPPPRVEAPMDQEQPPTVNRPEPERATPFSRGRPAPNSPDGNPPSLPPGRRPRPQKRQSDTGGEQ